MSIFQCSRLKESQIQNFYRSTGSQNRLESTKENVIGSLQSKLMSKFKVISQKSENSLRWAKKYPLTVGPGVNIKGNLKKVT